MGKLACVAAKSMDELVKKMEDHIEEHEDVTMDDVDVKSASLTYDERHGAWGLCIVYER